MHDVIFVLQVIAWFELWLTAFLILTNIQKAVLCIAEEVHWFIIVCYCLYSSILTDIQIESLEHEIQEKKKQMRVLEQRITESREASVANASVAEMQQVAISFVVKHWVSASYLSIWTNS